MIIHGHTSNGYNFTILWFTNPSEYGINDGRISKLWIYTENPCDYICNYDREWDILPNTNNEALMAAYHEILDSYN